MLKTKVILKKIQHTILICSVKLLKQKEIKVWKYYLLLTNCFFISTRKSFLSTISR